MTDIDTEPFEEILSDVDLKEKEFHGIVREITILCLISIILYIGSFAFLNLLRYVVTMLFLYCNQYTDTYSIQAGEG